METKKEMINKLIAKAEKCSNEQMRKAIACKIELLRENKTVTK